MGTKPAARKPMSVQEAGRLGGQRTSATHGPGHYQEIGHRGGSQTARTHSPEWYERIGRKGGAAMKRLRAAGRRAANRGARASAAGPSVLPTCTA